VGGGVVKNLREQLEQVKKDIEQISNKYSAEPGRDVEMNPVARALSGLVNIVEDLLR
jgi:hypothetical protein